MTVEDVNVALNIGGKTIAALRGKTTWIKLNPVARDSLKIPVYFLKLHKELFLKLDILFFF